MTYSKLYEDANNYLNNPDLNHKNLIWNIERDWIEIALGRYNSKHWLYGDRPTFPDKDRIQRGLMHEQGLGGPFNYRLACAWSHNDFDKERAKRVTKLASVKFDQVLNSVRSELEKLETIVNKDEALFNPKRIYIAERDVAKQLFNTLITAAQTFNSGTDNVDADAAQLSQTILQAIEIAKPNLIVKPDWETLISKLASIAVSLISFGTIPYILGRSMYGVFSTRVDVVEKLEGLNGSLKAHQI